MRRLRLLSRFHVLFILLSVLSTFVILQGVRNRNQARDIERTISGRTLPILQFQMDVLQMQRWLAVTAAGGEDAYIAAALEKAAAYEKSARAILKEQIFDHDLPVDLHNHLVELHRNLLTCYTKGRRMAEAYLNADPSAAQAEAVMFNEHAERFTAYIDALVDEEIRDLHAHLAMVNNRTDTIIFLSAVMIAAFIALGVISRRMNRQYTAQLEAEIDERKKAEAALRESEEKYRLLVENAEDAIFIAQDEAIKFSNPKTPDIIGYSAEELANIPFVRLIHPEDRGIVVERHMKRLKGEALPSTYPFRIITRAGGVLWVQLNTVLIQWNGRPATLNFLRDITGQREMEARMQQAQKLEAMGILAGGIAHDFNNLLMGIQGRVSLMLMDRDLSSASERNLREIESHIKSAADLTRQMLGFARGGKYEVTVMDMNRVLDQTVRMFGRTRKEVRIIKRFAPDLRAVAADRNQIEQVLLNLYVNAWQAMNGGGEIRLCTWNAVLDHDAAAARQAAPGAYVAVSVGDDGSGIAPEHLDKIFDPFFSTKGLGRGSGLGLASAYGIIKNHNGVITADSEPGKGSVFHIYLPATDKAVCDENPAEKTPTVGSGGVLLVDDERMVAEVAEEMIQNLGYQVISAGSGKEAVQIFEKRRDAIDLVILDMIMPDMDGGQVFDALKAIDRDVRVLLSSGYSINGQAMEILDRGCIGFLQKPFNLAQLSEKIRGALG